jgi:quercetin dioxygenase-like cupin family protein
MPDITRLFKGPRNEFEVEIVFAKSEDKSPKESHPFDEIIVVVAGSITIDLSGGEKTDHNTCPDFIEIPAGVEHVIEANATPTKLVIIHPDRKE